MAQANVFVAVGNKHAWIKPPDSGMSIAGSGWGSATQFTNGSFGTVASTFAGKGDSLGWAFLRKSQALDIRRLFQYAGTDPVFYLDPFAQDNILSAMSGTPYLLAETYSPVAYTEVGTSVAASIPSSGPNGKALLFNAVANSSVYTERIVIPEGYTLSVMASGTNTQAVLKVSGASVAAGTSVHVTASDGDVDTMLTIGNTTGATAQIEWVRGVIQKTGANVDLSEYAEPMGGGNMRVVPQTFTLTGDSAALGYYAAGVELREVWPWL